MSLRARLALLYSSITGGILLIFGMVIYILVGIFMVDHVDSTLRKTVADIIKNTRVDSVGELSVIILPRLDLTANVHIQVWGTGNQLEVSSSDIDTLQEPLDPDNLETNRISLKDVYVQNVHMRVLSVPFTVGQRPGGVIQAAASLVFVDSARIDLLRIIAYSILVSILLVGVAGWLGIGKALLPLKAVTETALQITHADDLSRRIPYEGPQNDETGQLIAAFNTTLERLEKLFSSQQRFLADVSHELRTPLTVIRGNVELMRRMKTLDEESLSGIQEEAERLTRLVEDLLLLAQAESGELPLDINPVELDALLLDVVKEMNVLAHERVQLKVTEIDQVLVKGDRDRLKQVLLNLIYNAIKYTPPGGEVYIKLGKNKKQARLIVRDTGPGIPASDLPNIFDRFYRTEKSRTRDKTGGFGLGLSIVYWIVSLHGGRIEVDSKEGRGSTFCIWLPLVEGETSETNP